MTDLSKYGWGAPGASKKYHVFCNAMSLCGNWMFTGELDPVEVNGTTGPKDCAACVRKLEALKKVP